MSRRGGWLVVLVSGVAGAGLLVAAPGAVPPAGAQVGAAASAGAVAALSVGGVQYTRVDLGAFTQADDSGSIALSDRGQVIVAAADGSPQFLWDPVKGPVRGPWGTRADSALTAVNDQGQVVGRAVFSGKLHAFLWDPAAGMTDLGTLGGQGSTAVAVNELGQVAGNSQTAVGTTHAFLWDPVAGMTGLGTLGGSTSEAVAVNELGQVAGNSQTAVGATHAFLWDPVAGMTDLGTLGGYSSRAVAVNERGQVTGTALTASGWEQPFLWDPVVGMTQLSASGTLARDLNDQGQVVGRTYEFNEDEHAFLWDPVVGMTDLGALEAGSMSDAFAVNERQQVVGWAETDTGVRAFLWDPVAGMTDLGTLGGYSSRAVAVNESGQVAGVAQTSSGEWHAVLWTPSELAPQLRVRVRRSMYRDRLEVRVSPVLPEGRTWVFRVQKRTSTGTWRTLPTVYRSNYWTGTESLGRGRFRVRVASRFGYAGVTSAAVRLSEPTARVLLATDSAQDKLRVNVDPNMGSGYWTFRVQRKRADGTWRTLPTIYRTEGSRETKTIDLRRGKYRVRVAAKYGYLGSTSAKVVRLVR